MGEMIDRNSTSQTVDFFPSVQFMGCTKNNAIMSSYINYLETLVSTDFTSESVFLGQAARWMYGVVEQGQVRLIKASQLGVQDNCGKPITLESLMGNTYVQLCSDALGMYVPYDEILKRTAYQWFARLSAKQVLESDTVVGKHLLITR